MGYFKSLILSQIKQCEEDHEKKPVVTMDEIIEHRRVRYPGDPMRPVTGSELTLDDLDGYYAEPKLDGNRVLLVHGLPFNRHGREYQRDTYGYLDGHWETLTDLYPYKVFDLEFMPTGEHKGKAALLDIPCDLATYEVRRRVMEERLPKYPHIGSQELPDDLFILPRTFDVKGTYKVLKSLWESRRREDSIWEGIVAKHKDSTYKFNEKGTWIKIRYK